MIEDKTAIFRLTAYQLFFFLPLPCHAIPRVGEGIAWHGKEEESTVCPWVSYSETLDKTVKKKNLE
jgi:hypothetical protein